MDKMEIQKLVEGCTLPLSFDLNLLDRAAEMFRSWGMSSHLNETEHLFESFSLASKPDDSRDQRMQKIALRFICLRIMESKVSRKDAAEIMENLNKIIQSL